MGWKIKAGVVALLVTTLSILTWQHRKIESLKIERDKYRSNTTTLLTDVETYRVRDSLNAAEVQTLKLSLGEFKRFRAEDAELIKSLRAKNRDLASVNKTQSETIIKLSATAKDTVVIVRDSIQVPAVAVHCGDAWYDFDGVLADGQFSGKLNNRDSLMIVESVKYGRFLGFLWKTKKIKDRKIEIVSKNPHTRITDIEHILIEK